MIFSTGNPVLPPKPPTMREYVRMVGALGGHLGRTCDGEPGTETLWRGMERVHDITRIYRVMAPHVPHLQNPAVSSSRDYG